MIKVQKIFVMAALVLIPSVSFAQKVNILTEKKASNRNSMLLNTYRRSSTVWDSLQW